MQVPSMSDFNEVVRNLQDLQRNFNNHVDERVAEIFREMAATADTWPILSFSDHLNNAAKKLENGE